MLFFFRLLALVAVLIAPISMIGGHAMAMPMKAQASAAHAAHHPEAAPGGEQEAPAHQHEAPQQKMGSDVDCAMACACVQPLGFRVGERVRIAMPHAPLPSPGLLPSRNPAADPPPPRSS